MTTIETICKFNKYGFCKYLSQCRKQHVKENCLEKECNNRNCLRRHPINCKFYDLYKRCKFGEYCAFAHRENPLVTELNTLKFNQEILKEDLNNAGNEVLDLKQKVEGLEKLVQELITRVENISTPTKKGTKKRRRVKQTLTPSPIHKKDEVTGDNLEDPIPLDEAHGQPDQDSDHGDSDITAEEIMKMYELG